MFITKNFVKKIGEMYEQKPCNDGYVWFLENFPKGGNHEDIFQKAIDDDVIGYCTWALAFSMPKEKNVKWAIWCAEQVMPIFEEKYPNDDRPRKAIETAKEYLKNPCDKTEERAAWAEWELAAWEAAAWAEWAVAWEADEAWEAARVAEWAAKAAREVAWAAAAREAARVACKANPDLSMQILQKGFEIWRRK